MSSGYIKILKKQISKLDAEDFDLEAWKISAMIVLNRVFGNEDVRARHIEQLKIDYSSWTLRDSNGNYKPIEAAKKKGKEILSSAIEEIEIFGVPKIRHAELIPDVLGEEISSMTEKERKKYFEGMKKDKLVRLLMKITSSTYPS